MPPIAIDHCHLRHHECAPELQKCAFDSISVRYPAPNKSKGFSAMEPGLEASDCGQALGCAELTECGCPSGGVALSRPWFRAGAVVGASARQLVHRRPEGFITPGHARDVSSRSHAGKVDTQTLCH